MAAQQFDRTAEDVGNIVAFEHVNLTVPDPWLAAQFYVNTLGLTRDPHLDLPPDLQWVNVGQQQFHLPLGDDQRLRGVVELAVPDLAGLERRLGRMASRFDGTVFGYETVVGRDGGGDADKVLVVTGPWGNRFRCRQSAPGARMQLGITGIDFAVPHQAAAGIGRFYAEVLGAPVTVADGSCVVDTGPDQVMRFTESADPVPDYDGHHVCVYVADFSSAHRWLLARDLIMEESNQYQYRFLWIADPGTGERIFEIEHEVRSLSHPLYGRPLVNRNPDQRVPTYVRGGDDFQPRRA